MTVYLNDPLGRLKQVTDAEGNVTTMNYDLAGRKIGMTDPDMGTWAYTYDAAGNLKTQIDNRSPAVTTTLNYDALQRVTLKLYSNGEPRRTFNYDSYPDPSFCTQPAATAKGRLAQEFDQAVATITKHCYDSRGRETRTQHYVGGVGADTYNVDRVFNDLNNVTQVTYPDQEIVQYGYAGDGGDLQSLTAGGTNIFTSAPKKPWHALASLSLSTSPPLTTTYGYDFRMRPTSIVTGAVQNLTLTYDLASNVQTMTDNTSPTETVTFAYDALNRLTGATGFASPAGPAAYQYSASGNLTSKQEASSLSLNYPAPGQPRPHAVTSAGGTNFTYDGNGNMTGAGGAVYLYDAENRLTQRPVGVSTDRYIYDNSGTMVRSEQSSVWTHYVEDIFEKKSTGEITKYYPAFGRNVAMREPNGTVRWLLADHLGSTRSAVNSSAQVLSSMRYWPYGATRSGDVTQTEFKFTSQREEPGDNAGLGIYNYKARFYSTTLGRFMSVDPVVGSIGTPQAWNPYAYVRNNPLSRIDPSGLDPVCLMGCPGSGNDVVVEDGRCGPVCGQRIVQNGYTPESWVYYLQFQSEHCASSPGDCNYQLSCDDFDYSLCTTCPCPTRYYDPAPRWAKIVRTLAEMCPTLSCDIKNTTVCVAKEDWGCAARSGIGYLPGVGESRKFGKLRHLDEATDAARAGQALKNAPLPEGIDQWTFGHVVMRWGRGNAEARTRIETLTREELVRNGVTVEIAESWRDGYLAQMAFDPGNPSAAGRADLMQRAVDLLRGN